MEMVDALREYADDWQDHLYNVPNHADTLQFRYRDV